MTDKGNRRKNKWKNEEKYEREKEICRKDQKKEKKKTKKEGQNQKDIRQGSGLQKRATQPETKKRYDRGEEPGDETKTSPGHRVNKLSPNTDKVTQLSADYRHSAGLPSS